MLYHYLFPKILFFFFVNFVMIVCLNFTSFEIVSVPVSKQAIQHFVNHAEETIRCVFDDNGKIIFVKS